MTRLAEIKAAAEAALRVDWVLLDPTIEQVEELARNGLWLVEHCEELARIGAYLAEEVDAHGLGRHAKEGECFAGYALTEWHKALARLEGLGARRLRMNLAGIKAAAETDETADPLYLHGDFVRRDGSHSPHYVRDLSELIEAYERAVAQRVWLVERVEALAIFARRVSLLDPTVGLMDVHEMVADARTALARLEGE